MENNRKEFIKCKPLQFLIKQKRLPMLFIGSGISKRYLKNYPNWEQLINGLANDVGITESQILAIKQEITDKNPHCSQSEIFKVIGENLTQIFRKKFIDGEKNLKDFFTETEIDDIKKFNIPFIKMLISKKFFNYEFQESLKLQNEIRELKKLQNNISVVITTNYDTFLEQNIFNNFDCFVEQSQYYMGNTEGIGEVYKIHGSIKKNHKP